MAHHHSRIRDASNDIELGLESEREVAKDAAEQIDRHEGDRDSDDLAVLVYLVVLWAFLPISSRSKRRSHVVGTYNSAEDSRIELIIPKNCTGRWLPAR